MRRLGDLPGGVAKLRHAADCGIPAIEANALLDLAIILEDNGDAPGAKEAYQRTIELRQPEHSGKAAVNLGILRSREMDLKGARAAWRAALEAGDPDEAAKARLMLARLAQLGDLDEAQEAVQQVDMNDPAIVGPSALAAGQVFLERGDLQSAVRSYERAMSTGHPLYAAKGAASVGVIFSFVPQQPETRRRRRGRQAASEQEHVQIAINKLTEVGHGHLIPRAWVCYGVMQVHGGKLAEADAAFRQVPDSASDAHAAALCALSILRGDFARSEAPYRRLVDSAPDLVGEVVTLVLDLGAYHASTGNHGAARSTFDLGCRMAELSGDPDLIASARQARDG
ncbi:MAG TPA: tetratricopeptide repeat protein [Actinocrinis sp.]